MDPATVYYQSGEDKVEGRLFSKPDAGPSLGVIVCPGRTREIDSYEWLTKPLADMGYVVMGTRYRDKKEGFRDSDVSDVINAINYLEGTGKVQMNNIAIVGHSRGGAASLLATALDSRVKAVVSIAPMTNVVHHITALKAYSPSRYAEVIKWHGTTPEEDPEYYRKVSPLDHANEVTVPTLLVHGKLDMINPIEHSYEMFDQLKKNGNQGAELHVVERCGHFLERSFHGYLFEEVRTKICDWLDKNFSTNK